MGIPSFLCTHTARFRSLFSVSFTCYNCYFFNCFSFTSIDALLIFNLFYGYLPLLVYGFFVIHYNYIFFTPLPCYKLPILQSLPTTSFAHCFIIFCLHRAFGPFITSSYSVLLFYFKYSSSIFKTLLFFASCVVFLLLCSFEDITRYRYRR